MLLPLPPPPQPSSTTTTATKIITTINLKTHKKKSKMRHPNTLPTMKTTHSNPHSCASHPFFPWEYKRDNAWRRRHSGCVKETRAWWLLQAVFGVPGDPFSVPRDLREWREGWGRPKECVWVRWGYVSMIERVASLDWTSFKSIERSYQGENCAGSVSKACLSLRVSNLRW